MAVNPREVIETFESNESVSAEELHRDLSLHMHRSYTQNHEGLEKLILLLRLASGALALEVVLWIAAIAAGQ